MNMRERIAKAIRDSGKKKSEIADLVGVSTAAVTQWESRETKTLKAENLMALAKATGRSPQWLATGEGPETPSNVEPGPRLRGLVPVISWVAAGAWDEAADPYAPGDGQDWKACPVSHSGRTYALRVRGDSMPDTYSPGDPVIIDRGVTQCDHDGIYFFRVGNEWFIKILQRIPGAGILVISQNKNYRDWTLTSDMDFEVFGKVLKAWKGRNY